MIGDARKHRPVCERPRSPVLEIDLAVGAPLTAKPALVHQVMMMPAKQYQVVEASLATIGPVFYMVPIDKSGVGAAREAATAVPGT